MNELRHYFHVIGRVADRYSTRQISNDGLNSTEVDTIRHLGFHESLSQQAIAEYLRIDKAAVARMLRKLEERGYVRRSRDEGDGRVKLVQATAAARALKDVAISNEDYFYDWLLAGLSSSERDTLYTIMQGLYARAEEAVRNNFLSIPQAAARDIREDENATGK